MGFLRELVGQNKQNGLQKKHRRAIMNVTHLFLTEEMNMISKNTPPMGWNTWNTFGHDVCEELILRSADAMEKSGLKEAGYEYIVIDDCWSLRERDENGRLVPDPEKFPHGMKYVADYVHSKGLKFGMYSCAGVLTCAQYPASYEHEYVDAATFAEWGVDFLKYDYCRHSIVKPGHISYKTMGLALANCGREILFSACSWGVEDTRRWIKETGADTWRSGGDIIDNWSSVKYIAQDQLKYMEFNGKGCYNDLDMLVVGMNGEGHVAQGGCTEDEYFTHFAFWCMYGSPLMIGCDLTKLDDKAKSILTNEKLIRIDQDTKHSQPFFINHKMEKNQKLSNENDLYYANYPLDTPILAKFLDDGKIAIGMFNFSDGETKYYQSAVLCESVGVPYSSGKGLKLTDVRTGEVYYSKNELFTIPNIPPHGSRVYIAEVVDRK